MAAVLLILILVATIALLPHIGFVYWYRKGISTVSPISLFGHFVNIIIKKEPLCLNVQHFYNAMKKKGKKFGGFYFLLRPTFVPTDLDLIKRMLINDFDHFTDHIGHLSTPNDPLSLNIFNVKGSYWRNLRLLLTPSFTSVKSKMMFDTALKCAEDLKQLINECVEVNESIDAKDIGERYTTDVIVSYGFGIESTALRNAISKFREVASEMLQSFRAILLFVIPELFSSLGLRGYGDEITNCFTNLVVETIKYRKKNGIVREDFIHHLIQNSSNSDIGEMKNTKHVRLSLSEMVAQCFVFYTAGYETSAAAISFTLTELALNQEIQNKVRDEINVILEKYSGEITFEAIKEMEYLDNCLYESLRKYPPLPTGTRLCTKSYKIPNSDVVINEGSYVFLPIYAVHRDPEYFPNPDKFDPDRFKKESTKNRQPSGFLPFGDGPRKCIAYKFGLIQSKVALIVLVKNFKFFLHPEVNIPLQFDSTVTLSTSSPLKLVAEKLEE